MRSASVLSVSIRMNRSSLSSAKVIWVPDLVVDAVVCDPGTGLISTNDWENCAARVGQQGRLQWPCILRYMENSPMPTTMRTKLKATSRTMIAPPLPLSPKAMTTMPHTQHINEDVTRMNSNRFFRPGHHPGAGRYVFLYCPSIGTVVGLYMLLRAMDAVFFPPD